MRSYRLNFPSYTISRCLLAFSSPHPYHRPAPRHGGRGGCVLALSLRASCGLPYRARRVVLRRSRLSGVLFVLACLAMVPYRHPPRSIRQDGRGDAASTFLRRGSFSSAPRRRWFLLGFVFPFYPCRQGCVCDAALMCGRTG